MMYSGIPVSCRLWVVSLVLGMGSMAASAPAVGQSQQDPAPSPAAASAAQDTVSEEAKSESTANAESLLSRNASTWDQATLERELERLFARNASMQKEYERAIDRAGMMRLVDGQRIQQDRLMTETRTIAMEVRRVVAEYRQRHSAAIDEMLKLIATAPLDAKIRDSVRPHYRALIMDAQGAALKAWDKEQAIAEGAVQLAEMLGASRTRWTFQDRRFAFTRNDDLNEFNRRMSALRTLMMEQVAQRLALEREAGEQMKTPR